MEQLFAPLIDAGGVPREAIRGCTDDEIAHLAQRQGVASVRKACRAFLRCGGRDPYWLSRDGEWDYEWALDAKDLAREIVVDDDGADLTSSDPGFWIYLAEEPVRGIGVRFSEWLQALADRMPRAVGAEQASCSRSSPAP